MTKRSQADIWIVGFPKSGNTWISYLSSYCFNLPFQNYGNPKEAPKQEWVRELIGGQLEQGKLAGFSFVQKTHHYPEALPHDDGLALYAIRDPRDVFVSYNYFMRSQNARLPGRVRYYLLGLMGKQARIKWFLKKWTAHLDAWRPHIHTLVSYDRLIAEGPSYLSALLTKKPFMVEAEIIQAAYEKFSFKNMSGGRRAGSEDQKSFFRKGISGDWRNHLTEHEARLFKAAVATYEKLIQ